MSNRRLKSRRKRAAEQIPALKAVISFLRWGNEGATATPAQQRPAPPAVAPAPMPEAPKKKVPFVRTAPRIGRNDTCSCGSGKKYKRCHLSPAPAEANP